MDKIIRFLKGYIQIKITGQEPIRFLNLCKMRGIFLWNINCNDQKIKACMRAKDYFLLHDILRKTGTKATVMKKNGMPFYIPRLKKKCIFFLAVILVLCYLLNMSRFIWRIDCEGNQIITDENILDFLEENDIHCGTEKKEIDIEAIEFELRKKFPQITWVCLSFQETRLLVSIKENQYVTECYSKEESNGTDLVANKDGIIVSIITRKGIPCVKAGDTVQKGDILVRGSVPVYDEAGEIIKYQIYDADATVIAQTKQQYVHSIDNIYEMKIYTGREKYCQSISFHDKVFKLPSFPNTYENYDMVSQKTQCRLFKHFYLPLYRYEQYIREYVKYQKKHSEQEVKEILYNDLEKIMLSFREKGVQIIQKNVRIKENVKKTELIADFFTYERIGIARAISELEKIERQ